MGVCQSTEVIKARNVSNRIDKQLQVDPKELVQKLLVLGPAESGKSTCVKQMQSMLELLEAKSDLCLEFEDKNMMNYANSIRKHIDNGLEFAPFNTQIKEAIQKLWQDPTIRIAFEKRADYHIHDSALYYFENIERIAEKDYRPTNQDILHTRVPTTGVVKLLFTLNGIDFK
uniref:Uncharacterized protein n=1 Tax=Meloidogyne javanica TaxID=6303 RepID=A0A915LCX4_MELJA